jgi:transcription elongation factor SPT6
MSHFLDDTAELGSEEEDGDFDEENEGREGRPRKENGANRNMEDSSEEDDDDDEEEIRKVSHPKTKLVQFELTQYLLGPRRIHR